jgi:hypothetical protein
MPTTITTPSISSKPRFMPSRVFARLPRRMGRAHDKARVLRE